MARLSKACTDDLWRDAAESLRQLIRCHGEENKAATGDREFKPPEWAKIAEDGIPLSPFRWDEDRRSRLRIEFDRQQRGEANFGAKGVYR